MANYICNTCGAKIAVLDENTVIRPCVKDCNEPIRAEIEVTVYSTTGLDA